MSEEKGDDVVEGRVSNVQDSTSQSVLMKEIEKFLTSEYIYIKSLKLFRKVYHEPIRMNKLIPKDDVEKCFNTELWNKMIEFHIKFAKEVAKEESFNSVIQVLFKLPPFLIGTYEKYITKIDESEKILKGHIKQSLPLRKFITSAKSMNNLQHSFFSFLNLPIIRVHAYFLFFKNVLKNMSKKIDQENYQKVERLFTIVKNIETKKIGVGRRYVTYSEVLSTNDVFPEIGNKVRKLQMQTLKLPVHITATRGKVIVKGKFLCQLYSDIILFHKNKEIFGTIYLVFCKLQKVKSDPLDVMLKIKFGDVKYVFKFESDRIKRNWHKRIEMCIKDTKDLALTRGIEDADFLLTARDFLMTKLIDYKIHAEVNTGNTKKAKVRAKEIELEMSRLEMQESKASKKKKRSKLSQKKSEFRQNKLNEYSRRKTEMDILIRVLNDKKKKLGTLLKKLEKKFIVVQNLVVFAMNDKRYWKVFVFPDDVMKKKNNFDSVLVNLKTPRRIRKFVTKQMREMPPNFNDIKPPSSEFKLKEVLQGLDLEKMDDELSNEVKQVQKKETLLVIERIKEQLGMVNANARVKIARRKSTKPQTKEIKSIRDLLNEIDDEDDTPKNESKKIGLNTDPDIKIQKQDPPKQDPPKQDPPKQEEPKKEEPPKEDPEPKKEVEVETPKEEEKPEKENGEDEGESDDDDDDGESEYETESSDESEDSSEGESVEPESIVDDDEDFLQIKKNIIEM